MMVDITVTEYTVTPNGIAGGGYTVQVQYAAYGGTDRWAVRRSATWGGDCLAVTGDVWDYEPTPSNRTPLWLADHRFPDLSQAFTAASNDVKEMMKKIEMVQ